MASERNRSGIHAVNLTPRLPVRGLFLKTGTIMSSLNCFVMPKKLVHLCVITLYFGREYVKL